ncbi:hypothetical protein WJX72_008694 [[Myrmecia] bisecta]|uniref:Uncharacterized protein n=1 Tax=[Myrmecia] bisecta TaxID=41462 RepID=A0AAW1QFU4_9CHLO
MVSLFSRTISDKIGYPFPSTAAKRKAARERRPEQDQLAVAPGGAKKRRSSGKSLNKLVKLLLASSGKRVVLLFALAICRTAISNRLARLQGYLFRASFLKKIPLFTRNLMENVMLCLVAASIESTAKTLLAHTELNWRQKLTGRIHKPYFDNMTYYKLSYVDRRISNPEQRVCEDIPKFCEGLSSLTREWINAVIDAAFYSYQLRDYTKTDKYTLAIVAYVVGAGVFTAVFAPNFGKLFKRQQANEGSYRHLHSRLRANAESVAFYGGIEKEGQLINNNFKDLVKHQARLLSTQWKFGIWQDFSMKYLGATVAVVLIIGPFFSGHLRPDDNVMGRAQMLSNMRYHTSVVISLFAALGTLGASSRRLMKLGAYADRIVELEDTVKEVSRGSTGKEIAAQGVSLPSENEIAFENAMVVTPADATLVKDLTVRVPAGTNLLVTGPNGAGKSSLFRVLGGLWPLTKGKMYKPGGCGGDGLSHEIFYVPQRPYVTVGTLQDQLIYPLVRQEGQGDVIPEERLRELLAAVDLESLAERPGGLDAVVDWGEHLSLGEQQRLGMARLFYHTPKFAILDECTSGVTVDMEERFCNMVKELGCTCVTISHRPALVAFHDLVLALDGDGGWSLHQGARASTTPFTEAHGGDMGKTARAGEAAAVLEGMRTAVAAHNKALQQGKLPGGDQDSSQAVIARAPPEDPHRHIVVCPPALALRPTTTSLRQRWKLVLRAMLGRGGQGQFKNLATIAVVVILRTMLQDRIASLNGRSVQHVLKQDKAAFVRLVGVSVLQSCASSVLAPSLRHVADMLALRWRQRLTAAVHAHYLKGNTFYSVSQLAGMQDVDQRVTRDVERLCDDLAALIPTMVKPVVDILWFSLQLGQLTGRRGMAILYLYSFLGFACLKLVTPDFGALAKKEYFLEGAFRNIHTRLRTHAESIAFFGGGAREGSTVSTYFNKLMGHLRRMIGIRWAYSIADDFFTRQLPQNVTWGLTLLYALDQKDDFADTAVQSVLVHDMRYLASVVTQCFTAFGELLALNKRFAELSGGVTRVSEMLETIQKAELLQAGEVAQQAQQAAAAEPTDGLEFRRVNVVTPSGKMLARELSFRVRPGRSILVTGPNGSGKSALFRILGGLWPLADGQIRKPGQAGQALDDKDIFYVPQKPYTTIGTLREQVIYPLSTAEAVAAEGRETEAEGLAALDASLDELMAVVRLQYLIEREGGWAATTEWGETLSLGEQQRLGMARLFFHCPRFGVLDECTNATSVDVEEQLYEHAAQLGITLITITQRTALVKFHEAELRLLDGQGDWELRRIIK